MIFPDIKKLVISLIGQCNAVVWVIAKMLKCDLIGASKSLCSSTQVVRDHDGSTCTINFLSNSLDNFSHG